MKTEYIHMKSCQILLLNCVIWPQICLKYSEAEVSQIEPNLGHLTKPRHNQYGGQERIVGCRA